MSNTHHARPLMRVHLNSSCFPGLATDRFVAVAAAAGAAGVDLNVLGRLQMEPLCQVAADLRSAIRASGLPVGAIHALMDWALPDDPDPRPALEAMLEVAVAVGASFIICVAPIRLEGLPPDDVVKRSAAERLALMAEVVRLGHACPGVRLALEQVGRSSTRPGTRSGIRRLDDALAIAEMAGPDVVLAVDSYNVATAGESVEAIRRIPPARLGIAHIADEGAPWGPAARDGRVLPGSGGLDMPGFVRALAESGYDGALSLELFPAAPWPDPLLFAREAVAAVQRTLEVSSQ